MKIKRKYTLIISLAVLFLIFTQIKIIINADDLQDGIEISSTDDLQKLEYSQNGVRYYLTKDIDLGGYGLWEPISEFKGILD